jgi:hypothetical protein
MKVIQLVPNQTKKKGALNSSLYVDLASWVDPTQVAAINTTISTPSTNLLRVDKELPLLNKPLFLVVTELSIEGMINSEVLSVMLVSSSA